MGVGIGVIAQPQLVVRFMTVKSNRELNRAVAAGGLFIFMMTGVAFVVGSLSNVFFVSTTGKVALAVGVDKIIPEYIRNFVPGWFGVIFLISLLAAAMSTLSSQFHVMGTSLGRDIYEKSLNKRGNSIIITRIGILFVILVSAVITLLSNRLDISVGIIAQGTSLFFGLCAATFLPAYVGALYFKTIPKIAIKWGMIIGFVSSFFYIFFIHGKNSAALQLCNLISGKPNLVAGTGLAKLAQYDAIIFTLPLSIIVTAVVWFVYSRKNKVDIEEELITKSFNGI
jgi:SSS family solute:Na+ symporter